MKILAIIPVYNEINHIDLLIKEIEESKIENYIDILFINNGSCDGSREVLEKKKFKVIDITKNRGVGYALLKGTIFAKNYNYDAVIHFAGNSKMIPIEMLNFRNQLLSSKHDIIMGSRFLDRENKIQNPIHRIFLIKISNILLSCLYKKKITDCSCGFRAIKLSIFNKIPMKKFIKKKLFTYGYEYYSYGCFILNKLNIHEIPATMRYPKKKYSKIRPFIDWFIIILFWIIPLIEKKWSNEYKYN
jgi:glycosyltransferase involved in cell wall biosynthesis